MVIHVMPLPRYRLLGLIGLSLLLFGACKEKREFNEETAQTSVDARQALGEMDEVLKDINTVIEERYTLRSRVASTGSTSVCGVRLDTTGQLQGKMTLIYDGTDCYGRSRTGVVSFTVQDYPLQKWKHKDCILAIDFTGYQATRGGRSVKLQGRQTLRNESGNSWFELLYGGSGPVTYVQEGDQMKVTFKGTETAVFSVKRRLTYSHSGGITSCRVEGIGSSLGRGNVEAWGQSTNGETFASEVTSPYQWKTTCGAVAPLDGEVVVSREGKEWDLKCRYGVDASGNAVSGAACPFGWEVTWSRKKKTNTRLFGYY